MLQKKNNNQASDCNSTQCPRVELDKEDRNPNQTATDTIKHTSYVKINKNYKSPPHLIPVNRFFQTPISTNKYKNNYTMIQTHFTQ